MHGLLESLQPSREHVTSLPSASEAAWNDDTRGLMELSQACSGPEAVDDDVSIGFAVAPPLAEGA